MTMNNLPDNLPDWSVDELFRRAAERRKMTPEQLHARLRTVADDERGRTDHLSFERLRDAENKSTNFTDQELGHLEHCRFCSRLLATINPSMTTVEEFGKKAALLEHGWLVGVSRSVFATPAVAPAPAQRFSAAAAKGVIVAFAVGAIAMFGVNTFRNRDTPDDARLMVSNSIASESWAGSLRQCAANGAQRDVCKIFVGAAQAEASGNTPAAQVLVSTGLTKVGFDEPVVLNVSQAILTEPANSAVDRKAALAALVADPRDASQPVYWLVASQQHFTAGQSADGYKALAKYLASAEPDKHAAYTVFETAFVRPLVLRESANGESQPELLNFGSAKK